MRESVTSVSRIVKPAWPKRSLLPATFSPPSFPLATIICRKKANGLLRAYLFNPNRLWTRLREWESLWGRLLLTLGN